jgi:hypothetical protein
MGLKKNMKKKIVAFKGGGGTQETIYFGDELNFIIFSFFLNASTNATYIFIVPTCTTIIIILKPCALDVKC